MCCGFAIKDKKYRPGETVTVTVHGEEKPLVWAGFAQKEKLDWWVEKKGFIKAVIPAEQFSERADDTREIQWDVVPEGMVIAALVDSESPIFKVLTRAATEAEEAKFRHPRMPYLVPVRQ